MKPPIYTDERIFSMLACYTGNRIYVCSHLIHLMAFMENIAADSDLTIKIINLWRTLNDEIHMVERHLNISDEQKDYDQSCKDVQKIIKRVKRKDKNPPLPKEIYEEPRKKDDK